MQTFQIGSIAKNDDNKNKGKSEEKPYPLITDDRRLVYKDFELDLKKGLMNQVYNLKHRQY
jgi:hypothetical protein